jgi:hypothetical protein
VAEGLSEQIRHFIARYIISVEQLEILLLLSGDPKRLWTAADVFNKIRSSPGSVQEKLDFLRGQGFVCSETIASGEVAYLYRPSSPQLSAGAALLGETYRERPTKVIEAIFAKPDQQLQSFIDAFTLRKGDKTDGR